jgi:hypothetical protein
VEIVVGVLTPIVLLVTEQHALLQFLMESFECSSQYYAIHHRLVPCRPIRVPPYYVIHRPRTAVLCTTNILKSPYSYYVVMTSVFVIS